MTRHKCKSLINIHSLIHSVSARLEPVGYGINKLRIMAVVEDLKVSIDDLGEKICTDFEDLVSLKYISYECYRCYAHCVKSKM